MYELASLSSLMEREVVPWVRGGLSLVNYKKRLESGTSVSESRPLSPAPHHLPTRWLFFLPGEHKELGCIHQDSLSIPVFLYVAGRECRASWHMPEPLTPLAAPSATLHLLRAHGLQSGGTGSGCWWPARWVAAGKAPPHPPSAGSHRASLPNGKRARWVQNWLLTSAETCLAAETQPGPTAVIKPRRRPPAKNQRSGHLAPWFPILRVGQRCLRSQQRGEEAEQPERCPSAPRAVLLYLSYLLLFYLQLYLNKDFCCYI